MRIAVIGQSLFGQEVYKELRKDGHTIVTVPDKDGKADPLGEPRCRAALQTAGSERGLQLGGEWRSSSGNRLIERL